MATASNLRRPVLRSVAAAVLAVACGFAAHAADIKERNIKFPIVNQLDHPQGVGAKKFAELVEQKSGGKMKVKIFAGGTLGGEQQVASAM